MSEQPKFRKVGGAKTYFKYKDCKPGQVLVDGLKYLGRSPNKFGNDNFDFQGNPPVCLNYSGHLEYLISTYVRVGDSVRVIYAGVEVLKDGKFKGKECHKFELEVAEEDEVTTENTSTKGDTSSSEDISLGDLE